MKEFINGLALFLILSVAFSACTGTQADNNNLANGKKLVLPGEGGKGSAYPPLASGIAEGEIVLLDGTKTKVSEQKGNVVILNLWGIWCGPCREEMPHLQAMHKQYADQGLKIFGLNIGDSNSQPEAVENIKKFAENMKIDYTLARVEYPIVSQFYLLTKQQVVPQTFLVDREGRLRGTFIGGGQRNFDMIKQNLDKLMAE